MNIRKVLHPVIEFTRLEAFGGILLIISTLVALIWANSPWHQSYFDLWHTELGITVGDFSIAKSLSHWINDGLMAIFFFVVGLEIKRELMVGALATRRKAMLPLFAALGGMLVPAIIFISLNWGGAGDHGWGIPMATDIAFAMGVFALLGRYIPLSLKIFLLAVAIVDDIGAVLVIAVFYSSEIVWTNLAVAGGIFALLLVMNRFRVNREIPYLLLGLVMWFAFLKSGVHATIAGVLLALTIPANTRINTDEFLKHGRAYLDDFDKAGEHGKDVLANRGQQRAVQALEMVVEQVETPLQRLERNLHYWVVYVIMPLFALANAGVLIDSGIVTGIFNPVSIGIILGLVVGKPLGIVTFSWLAFRLGVADRLESVTWRHIIGAGFIAGIGFTMSLFISGLAFEDGTIADISKAGIILGSLIAAVIGALLIRGAKKVEADSS